MDIPKKIHYCWFGGNPLGSEELKCIESWRRYFPGYEIIRWDESNFDVRCCPYVSQAYETKKWAFVSDYVRFAVLYRYGGIYFDTDVEVIRPMDDIVAKGPFMGFEVDADGSEGSCTVNPGVGLSAGPGLEIYKQILASYEADEFIKPDGTMNLTTVVVRTTGILRSCGLSDTSGIQEVAGVTIYPSEYFNPKDFFSERVQITANTRSIHHFGMSWYSEKDSFEHAIGVWGIERGLSVRAARRMALILTIIRFADIKRALHILQTKITSRNNHGGATSDG